MIVPRPGRPDADAPQPDPPGGSDEPMDATRFRAMTDAYRRLKVVVAGDFCLDRYLHIDPALEEVSLETHLPAHQVVAVRPQAGGAGNVLANVAALSPAEVRAVGVIGDDGEGLELTRALAGLGADLDGLIRSDRRRTFTYTKPLLVGPDGQATELSRLDIKDRTPMPADLAEAVVARLSAAAADADAVILMEQVDDPARGALSAPVKVALADIAARRGAGAVFLADSRCDVLGCRGVDVKVNRDELHRAVGDGPDDQAAAALARRIGRRVFVTLGADGMLSADAEGNVLRAAGVRVAGPVDIVGAGDAVLAHLAMALAGAASVAEAMAMANLAGAVVVGKLGTTGTATVAELAAAEAR